MKHAWIFLFLVLFSTCKKAEVETTCGTTDPYNELTWLKNQIDYQTRHNPDTVSIKQYSYIGDEVFLLTNYPLTMNYGSKLDRQLYGCDGSILSQYWVALKLDEVLRVAQYQKTIWRKDKTPEPASANVCGVANVLTDLDWPARNIQFLTRSGSKKAGIFQYEYAGQTVFYIIKSAELGESSGIAVLDCTGKNLMDQVTWDHTDFMKKAKIIRTIWQK